MDKILLIDDDRSALKLISKMVESLGYECIPERDPRAGLEKMRHEKFSVVITDLIMPDIDGLEVLKQGLKMNRNMQVILVTAVSELAPAVEAIKAGAADYIQKPLDKDQIKAALVRVLQKKKLVEENRQLKARLDHYSSLYDIIGRSESMIKIFKTIERVANTNASVLIHGESGTGKEMIANAIHKMSIAGTAHLSVLIVLLFLKSFLKVNFLVTKKALLLVLRGRGKVFYPRQTQELSFLTKLQRLIMRLKQNF